MLFFVTHPRSLYARKVVILPLTERWRLLPSSCRSASGSEVNGVHSRPRISLVGSRAGPYSDLAEVLVEDVGLVPGAVHPVVEDLIRGAFGAAAVGDVLPH